MPMGVWGEIRSQSGHPSEGENASETGLPLGRPASFILFGFFLYQLAIQGIVEFP